MSLQHPLPPRPPVRAWSSPSERPLSSTPMSLEPSREETPSIPEKPRPYPHLAPEIFRDAFKAWDLGCGFNKQTVQTLNYVEWLLLETTGHNWDNQMERSEHVYAALEALIFKFLKWHGCSHIEVTWDQYLGYYPLQSKCPMLPDWVLSRGVIIPVAAAWGIVSEVNPSEWEVKIPTHYTIPCDSIFFPDLALHFRHRTIIFE
ncbi:hypothetical protein CC78DRAFT_543485 [Lojkania enalia]|uniref:Uncharacterized protein n=1 Tax=Lojkania enalia TaxID=147567 RepID=A0A9P4K9G0_9PLEO|nr:hypothetical protein CC78DRAFT_543485 [Didymosphaeria enalia]